VFSETGFLWHSERLVASLEESTSTFISSGVVTIPDDTLNETSKLCSNPIPRVTRHSKSSQAPQKDPILALGKCSLSFHKLENMSEEDQMGNGRFERVM
jgi:hypothetical protein